MTGIKENNFTTKTVFVDRFEGKSELTIIIVINNDSM